jgi:hypothetical protein
MSRGNAPTGQAYDLTLKTTAHEMRVMLHVKNRRPLFVSTATKIFHCRAIIAEVLVSSLSAGANGGTDLRR